MTLIAIKESKMKIILFVIISLFAYKKSFSQVSASLHLGPSFPVSDFMSLYTLDNKEVNGASIGFNISNQYIVPLSKLGFGLFGGIDFNYNDVKKESKNSIEGSYKSFIENYGAMSNLIKIKHIKYINLPLSTGINYSYDKNDQIGVFINSGLVFNCLKTTNFRVSHNNSSEGIINKFELATNFGFKIEGGILISQKIYLSFAYLGLGQHKVKGEFFRTSGDALIDDSSEEFTTNVKVDVFNLTVGLKL